MNKFVNRLQAILLWGSIRWRIGKMLGRKLWVNIAQGDFIDLVLLVDAALEKKTLRTFLGRYYRDPM